MKDSNLSIERLTPTKRSDGSLRQVSHQLLRSVYGAALVVTGILACDWTSPQGPAAPRIPRGWQGARARQSRNPTSCQTYRFINSGNDFRVSNLSPKKTRKGGSGGKERNSRATTLQRRLADQRRRLRITSCIKRKLCDHKVDTVLDGTNPNSLVTRYVEFYLCTKDTLLRASFQVSSRLALARAPSS